LHLKDFTSQKRQEELVKNLTSALVSVIYPLRCRREKNVVIARSLRKNGSESMVALGTVMMVVFLPLVGIGITLWGNR
jgi:hypothetical protein